MSGSAVVITILCFGDVVGRPGRLALSQGLRGLRESYNADFVIANGENAAGGTGLDRSTANEIFDAGVDLITLGDHTWQKKELVSVLESESHRLIRPANYPEGAAGRGWAVHDCKGVRIGVCNLMGRVFMNQLIDCPFRTADQLFAKQLNGCTVKIVDMHAEATSEKIAMGRNLDGKASLVFGTHTHVQTADETILPGGTAFITDLGMTGSAHGVIGMDAEVALNRFTTGRPHAYKIAEGSGTICGVALTVDAQNGKAKEIKRIMHAVNANSR